MKRITLEQFAQDPDPVLDAANVAPVLIINPKGDNKVLINAEHLHAMIDELKAHGVDMTTEMKRYGMEPAE